MSEYKWLNKSDYLDNMKPVVKCLFRVGVIKYAHRRQTFSGGKYCGRFTYVYYNPLTWIYILFALTIALTTGICYAFFCSVNEVIEFVNDGVLIKIDRDYNSKTN